MRKLELLTLKEAIIALNKAWGVDPETAGRNAYCEKTLYQYIWKKKLKRHGPRHIAQVDKFELLSVMGPKKAS